MATLITDPELEKRIRADRAERKIDRFDEVWEGTYIITPPRDNEHQDIRCRLGTAIHAVFGDSPSTTVYLGVNVSDRDDDWAQNYRCPDVVVVFASGVAQNRGDYHLGGPDFVVEIVSPLDRGREKIGFYERISVRELLLVDRDPWALELYRLDSGRLDLVGKSRLDQPDILASAVLPLSFQLVSGETRPRIAVCHADGVQKWVV